MVAPALLAGGNMGTGVASLNLIWGGGGGGPSSHLRRCRGPDGFDDDKDGLPEWCLDDEDEEMGTFDASGAFLPLKVSARRRGEIVLEVGGLLPAPRGPFHGTLFSATHLPIVSPTRAEGPEGAYS